MTLLSQLFLPLAFVLAATIAVRGHQAAERQQGEIPQPEQGIVPATTKPDDDGPSTMETQFFLQAAERQHGEILHPEEGIVPTTSKSDEDDTSGTETEEDRVMRRKWGRGWAGYSYAYPYSGVYGYPYNSGYNYGHGYPFGMVGYGQRWGMHRW